MRGEFILRCKGGPGHPCQSSSFPVMAFTVPITTMESELTWHLRGYPNLKDSANPSAWLHSTAKNRPVTAADMAASCPLAHAELRGGGPFSMPGRNPDAVSSESGPSVGSAGGAGTARPGRLVCVPPAATSNRACGSPAHGSPTSFTGWHTQGRDALEHRAAGELVMAGETAIPLLLNTAVEHALESMNPVHALGAADGTSRFGTHQGPSAPSRASMKRGSFPMWPAFPASECRVGGGGRHVGPLPPPALPNRSCSFPASGSHRA